MEIQRLAILGTGLIGASVALAAKRAGAAQVVAGFDPDPAALEASLARGALDEPVDSLAVAVAGAELVVVAAPVAQVAAQVRAALEASGDETTVTDVGSTKSGACEAAGRSPRFVGGHPVSGSEARGAEHASAELFDGATWFLTPLAETDPARYRLVHGFVSALGATPVAVDPQAHDRLVALTSHLPHALANLLVNQAGATRVEGHEPLAAAGGSLRDMTRVAGANPRIWVDIFVENAASLRESLAEHRRRVEQLEAALDAGDAGFLARWIGEAAGNRRQMLADAFPDPGELQQLRVHVPDRPGVLAGITQALGAERINIEDFELHHVSPGPRRDADAPRHRRRRGRAGGRAARVAGLRRRRLAGAGRMKIEPATALRGHIAVPGDKSISHRAVLVGAIADGETLVEGFGRSADTESTIAAVRRLGVTVHEDDVDTIRVEGAGLRGLRQPEGPVDCGNSGTTLRLLAGILAGQEGRFELTGDESLRRRPMERIAEPLALMGASVGTNDGKPPLLVEGGELNGIRYELPVASAQVKSCVLLAGLYAQGRTTVVEPVPTRDHTERLLAAAGAPVTKRQGRVSVGPAESLRLGSISVPGDFSAAAPFLVAATLLPGSELTIHDVGLNPTRTGLLDVLERMGARITIFHRQRSGGEPIGDLEVHSAELTATAVRAEEIPRLVDELPLFALAAACARGESRVEGARELRVKETDRIETVTTALRSLGVRITPRDDGFRVRGVPTRPRGGTVSSQGDHRIAILAAVAGLVSSQGVDLEGAEAVAVSFPGFFELLDSVTQR